MTKMMAICGAILLAPAVAFAQEKPAEKPQGMQHEHNGGPEESSGAQKQRFMQGGMHHAVAKGVTLDAKVDAATHTITLRVGPMDMPARTSHRKMPQPQDLIWAAPVEGWLLAYTPKLMDGGGNIVPGRVLHHVAFWNESRADFLCPNKEEHIFGAGSELTPWMQVPGYGYRVKRGDQIRIETMIYNPTDTSYEKVYLEVVVPFQEASENTGGAAAASPKNYYPAWMDVMSCGNSGYDLPAGKSGKTGTVTVKYAGALLGVGGHMHDYANQIVLEDVSRKETVATLDAKVDAQGQLESMPTKIFFDQGGYKFASGDVLKISATYNNPTGRLLRDAAMGIVVGYFVPADHAALDALRRQPKPTHDMATMSHDH